MFQNNLFAPFILMRGLCYSLKRHRGAIVNLGVAGVETIRADVYSTAYCCAAKLSLWMMTKSFARELAPASGARLHGLLSRLSGDFHRFARQCISIAYEEAWIFKRSGARSGLFAPP